MLCLGQPMPATLSTAHNNLNPIPTCIPWSAPRGATQCPHTISTIRPKHNASAGQMQGQNWTHTCLLGSTWVLCPPMPNSSAPHQTRQGPVHPQQVPEPATPPNLKSWNAAKARLPLLAQHHTSHHTKCNNVTNLNIFLHSDWRDVLDTDNTAAQAPAKEECIAPKCFQATDHISGLVFF